jgi:predicted RNA-binding protein YlqC (UPF0109 family)
MFKKLFSFLTGGDKKETVSSAGGSLNDLEAFVEYVVKTLVDKPQEVEITTIENDEGATIQIRCCKEDIGKIVGKRGKTIMAIRSLVSGAAGRQRKRVSVDVMD